MLVQANQLQVSYLTGLNRHLPIKEVSDTLDTLPKFRIAHAPWPAYNYVPAVSFSLAHSRDCLFLKYYVSENAIRARYRQTNDPVYKDSCVEFFIAFNEESSYYNFEFNCVGTCLAGFGKGRENRQFLPEAVIEKIKRWAVMQTIAGDKNDSTTSWQLTLIIPIEVFCQHQLVSLQGMRGKANFYKCGDDLPQPHYLAWNNIVAEKPDFHLPEFFGNVVFK